MVRSDQSAGAGPRRGEEPLLDGDLVAVDQPGGLGCGRHSPVRRTRWCAAPWAGPCRGAAASCAAGSVPGRRAPVVGRLGVASTKNRYGAGAARSSTTVSPGTLQLTAMSSPPPPPSRARHRDHARQQHEHRQQRTTNAVSSRVPRSAVIDRRRPYRAATTRSSPGLVSACRADVENPDSLLRQPGVGEADEWEPDMTKYLLIVDYQPRRRRHRRWTSGRRRRSAAHMDYYARAARGAAESGELVSHQALTGPELAQGRSPSDGRPRRWSPTAPSPSPRSAGRLPDGRRRVGGAGDRDRRADLRGAGPGRGRRCSSRSRCAG